MSVYTNGFFDPVATAAHSQQIAAMSPQRAAEAQARGNVQSTIYSQPAEFAKAYGEMFGAKAAAGAQGYGAYSQGLTGLGASQANAYNGYAGGMGNVATAMANERSNFYGANAMAEAARQGAMGNIGSAALGAYGSASNAAMNAWAQNQTAYNKSLSDMVGVNQTGLSNYGVGRNQALASLGDSYAKSGIGFAGANVLSDLDLNAAFSSSGEPGLDGGGFTAGGPDGDYASGGYGPSPGGGGTNFTLQAKKRSDGKGFDEKPTMDALGGLRGDIMSSEMPGMMNNNFRLGMGQLDAQHYSSRSQPSQMMDQSLQGLMALSGSAYGNNSRGMDQFYGSQNDPNNRADFSQVLGGLGSGFRDTSNRLGALASQMGDGYSDMSRSLDEGYMSGLGRVGGLASDFRRDSRIGLGLPKTLEDMREQWAVEDATAARAASKRAPRREYSPYLNNFTDREVRSIAQSRGVEPTSLRSNINKRNRR